MEKISNNAKWFCNQSILQETRNEIWSSNFRDIFRIFLIKIDTLNLSYFDQREKKSQGSSKNYDFR